MISYIWLYSKTYTDPPVVSTETWNGGAGDITFNHLQQRPVEPTEPEKPPINTDIWGITDNGAS